MSLGKRLALVGLVVAVIVAIAAGVRLRGTQKAVEVVTSGRMGDALDVQKEDKATLKRYMGDSNGNGRAAANRNFRRTLKIPLGTSSAARVLREGKTRMIDVGRVTFINHDGEEDTRFLLGVASFGMSAAAIDRVKDGGPGWVPTQSPKWLKNRISYGASMLQTAMKSPTTRVVVQLDDDIAVLVAVEPTAFLGLQ